MKKTIILLLIIQSCIGCSIVNKAFHKNKTVVDSTSTVHEKKDSVVNTDIVEVHKDSSRTSDEIVIEFTGDSATITGKTDSNDYFYLNQKTGEIKASRVPKKVTIKGSSQAFNYDSLADHSKIEKTEEKSSDTHVTKKEKEVTKEVKKTKIWWWLLLLIPVYIIYRNWPKIKAWFKMYVLHIPPLLIVAGISISLLLYCTSIQAANNTNNYTASHENDKQIICSKCYCLSGIPLCSEILPQVDLPCGNSAASLADACEVYSFTYGGEFDRYRIEYNHIFIRQIYKI